METRVKENWTDVKKRIRHPWNPRIRGLIDSRKKRMKIERDLQDRRRKRKMEQIYPVAVIVNLFNLREQIFANSVNGTRVALSSISSKRH